MKKVYVSIKVMRTEYFSFDDYVEVEDDADEDRIENEATDQAMSGCPDDGKTETISFEIKEEEEEEDES